MPSVYQKWILDYRDFSVSTSNTFWCPLSEWRLVKIIAVADLENQKRGFQRNMTSELNAYSANIKDS
jgi:hypothetical protein